MPHPLRITRCEIIVDGDDMHAFARQCIQIDRCDSDQGLSFSCLHLGDDSFMENDASEELDIIRDHIPDQFLSFDLDFGADHPLARLLDCSERFREDIVQGLALCEPVLEFLGLRLDLIVGQRIEFSREFVYLFHDRPKLVELFLVVVSGYQIDDLSKHCFFEIAKIIVRRSEQHTDSRNFKA